MDVEVEVERAMIAAQTKLGALLATVLVSACVSAPVFIPDAQQFTLATADGSRTFQIFVAGPTGPMPERGYPTLYVLDANRMFATAVETVRALGQRGDTPRPLNAIVVGIGYPPSVDVGLERSYDLTPPTPESLIPERMGRNPDMRVGGAAQFLTFIEETLKPQIAARYDIDPEREALFGHSFGGLFTLYALFERPGAFDVYVAASPSIWWGEKLILKHRRAFTAGAERGEVSARLLVTVGAYEQDLRPESRNWPGADALALRLAGIAQVTNAVELAAALDATPGLEVRADVIANEDHGTVIPGALSRATVFFLMTDD